MTAREPSAEAMEFARRWYWNGSLYGGLGADTDKSEAQSHDLRCEIRRYAAFGEAIAREFAERMRERAAAAARVACGPEEAEAAIRALPVEEAGRG